MVLRSRFGYAPIALFTPLFIVGLASSSMAGIIATDSYQVGGGGYTLGPLKSAGNVGSANGAIGFVTTGGYTSGSGTSNFLVNSGGLLASDPANAGNVSFSGTALDNSVRSVARNLSPTPVTNVGTYWFGINVSQDGSSSNTFTPVTGTPSTTGYALAGFGNTVPPQAGTTSGELQGLFFGFAHETGDASGSNADLVIRYRNGTDTSTDAVLATNATANMTYTIIASLSVNVGGGSADYLSYWVNPTNTSSIAAMDASSMVYSDYADNTSSANPLSGGVSTLAFQTAADFTRLTYSAQDWNGDNNSAAFGDPTLGTSLTDVAYLSSSVPEPSSLVMMGTGIVGCLGMAYRRHRKNRA